MNDTTTTVGKFRYGEGDCFAVPAGEDVYALGVIVRISKNRGGKTRRRILTGYFYGPYPQRPTSADLYDLKPQQAVLIVKTQDEGLYTGRWVLLGKLPSWDRVEWNPPPFVRTLPISGETRKVFYEDGIPLGAVREQPCSLEEARGFFHYVTEMNLGIEKTLQRLFTGEISREDLMGQWKVF